MTYSTLLVHLDGGRANESVLAVAARIAEQHGARIIGIAACQPMQIASAEDFTGAIVTMERQIVVDELKRAKTEFHDNAGIRPFVLEWRSTETLDPVSHLIADQSRCADLVITSLHSDAARHGLTHADTGELIIRAGRPVLVVPNQPAATGFATVIVAWADTRECRCAVAQALPILKLAAHVIIVAVTPDLESARSQTQDVVAWLSRHHIDADHVVSQPHDDPLDTLQTIAAEHRADLIVAGAYGHNRLREWAFGGMTRDLLLRLKICALLSH